MSRRDWWKVRRGWYETHSHIDLSFNAINLGPLLMGMADESDWEETGIGVICPQLDKPKTLRRIARAAHADSVEQVEEAISELVDAGTLKVVDGKWVFPNYRPHQEDPRTTRRRRKSGHCPDIVRANERTGERALSEHLPGEAEAEAEAEAELSQKTSSSDQSPSEGDEPGRRTSRKVKDLIDPVWDWFEDECVSRGFARKRKGLSAAERGEIVKLNTHVRSTLGIGQKREDTDRVIATLRACLSWKLDQAEIDRTSRKYIRGVSPWRRKSFDYWWAHVADATEPMAPSGREPQTPAEADAWCVEHGKYPKGWTFKRGEWVRK